MLLVAVWGLVLTARVDGNMCMYLLCCAFLWNMVWAWVMDEPCSLI